MLVDAVAAGRPVVATRFPHAVELLGGGAGLLVEREPAALATGIRSLLEDDDVYGRALETVAGTASEIGWESSAEKYADLLRSLVPASLTVNN